MTCEHECDVHRWEFEELRNDVIRLDKELEELRELLRRA